VPDTLVVEDVEVDVNDKEEKGEIEVVVEV
jgi:hypothetical protein